MSQELKSFNPTGIKFQDGEFECLLVTEGEWIDWILEKKADGIWHTVRQATAEDKIKIVQQHAKPGKSCIPDFYIPPMGLPLNWRQEATGELPSAVFHYFDWCCGPDPDVVAEDEGTKPLSERELKLIIDYANHFINAPCWEKMFAGDDELMAELKQLQFRAKLLASVESIRRWNSECQEICLDPF